MWSTNVLASMTQIGASILATSAKCKMLSVSHRDGLIVDVGPAEGPNLLFSVIFL